MIGIIGKKLGMTQIFNEQGQQIPCTVVEATPNPVTKVMEKAKAGFASVELGLRRAARARESKKGERTPRASRDQGGSRACGEGGLERRRRVLRSFRLDDAPGKNPESADVQGGAT
jgi:large subunit ribosomal protein L3